MTSAALGEFMGTLTLIVLGDGVVAGVLLKKSKAENSGWIVITAGWAFAVMCGIFVGTACGSPDAHLNPAVTMGFAVYSGDYSKFVPYVTAQLLGAFTGAALVWIQYLPHWKETPDAGLKLACFCTGPAIRNATANLMSEIIATFFLVFVVGSIFSRTSSINAFTVTWWLSSRMNSPLLRVSTLGSNGLVTTPEWVAVEAPKRQMPSLFSTIVMASGGPKASAAI